MTNMKIYTSQAKYFHYNYVANVYEKPPSPPVGLLNIGIKIPSYQNEDTHYTDKKISLPFYLYYRDPYICEDGLYIEIKRRKTIITDLWNHIRTTASQITGTSTPRLILGHYSNKKKIRVGEWWITIPDARNANKFSIKWHRRDVWTSWYLNITLARGLALQTMFPPH